MREHRSDGAVAESEGGLVLEDVRLEYRGAQALDSLSLKVEEGGSVALLGANGVGKTSTIRAVSGILPMYDGTVTAGRLSYRGRDLSRLGTREIVRAGIAHVPEGRKVFADLNVLENLRVAARPHRKAAIAELVAAMFELFPPLDRRRSLAAGHLSGGEQQMLAIARAMMTEPSLLMIDELSLGLAPQIVRDIMAKLDTLRSETGVSLLLIEQNARVALNHTDYAYILEAGRVTHQGPSSELADNPEVERRYLGVKG